MLLKNPREAHSMSLPFTPLLPEEKDQEASKLELQQYIAPMEVSLHKQQCSFQIVCSAELPAITLIKHLFTKQSLGSLVMFLITHTYQLLNQSWSQS